MVGCMHSAVGTRERMVFVGDSFNVSSLSMSRTVVSHRYLGTNYTNSNSSFTRNDLWEIPVYSS